MSCGQLSAGFSPSPTVVVVLRASRCKRLATGSLALLLALALWALVGKSHPWISMPVSLALLGLALLRGDPGAGLTISCQDGCWRVGSAGQGLQRVVPERGGLTLPWLFQLRWRIEGGAGAGGLWVFPDSADAASLAALRRCLLLAGR